MIAFVTFPGNEIMDLFVHEEEETAKTPQIAPTLPSEPKQNKSKADNNRRQDENKPVSAPRAPAEKSNSKPAPKKENNAKTVVGSGEHLLKLKERKAGDAPVATEGEFDFQAGLTVFKKTEILAQVAEAGVEAVKETKYVKDDFFDMISNDQLDREEGRRTKMTGSQERSVNQDTFGATALQGGNNYRRYNNNYGGRGRGRGGGGGRGRGRGRGRSSAPTN